MKPKICECGRSYVDESPKGDSSMCDECDEYFSKKPIQRFPPPAQGFLPSKTWEPSDDDEDDETSKA